MLGKDPPISFTDLKITVKEVSIVLTKILPVYDAVFKGYSTYQEKERKYNFLEPQPKLYHFSELG